MVQLPLTLEARVKLGYILVQLTGTMEDVNMWAEVGQAIALSSEDKTSIDLKESRSVGGDLQQATWSPTAIALKDEMIVSLETDHAKRLLSLMGTYQGFRATDRDWTKATVAALKAVV